MTKQLKIGFISVGVLVLALWLRGCYKDRHPVFTGPLPVDTAGQVVIANRHVAVRTDKSTVASYVPDDGEAIINLQRNGQIQLNVKQAGFKLRPVAGLLVTDRARIAGGLQLAYFNRLELYIGGGMPQAVAFIGLGYRLDVIPLLQNTSVFVAYTTRKDMGLGILLRF